MAKFLKINGVVLVSILFLMGGFTGCTPKPSNEEVGKLEQARAAAESAERKLSDLRMERMKLEQELGGAKAEEEDEQQELEESQP
ncbi:MAG: hypothetical protein JW913_02600 [Chitinispirillaceae bacterium]|nr:hypothetical protein [Chitinispirillaceae bacterium]